MSSSLLSQYLPLVKQALLVNSLLIVYYLMPNLTTFLLSVLLIAFLLAPSSLQNVECCQSETPWSINTLFRSYLEQSNVRKLMVIVGFGVVAQLTYLFPSWFVLLLAAQVLAFWDILVGLGLVELAFSAVNQTETAITKFLNLIPRYQE